ncbi:Fe(3+)-hydroxamate ABC transporter permease FhuB [[Mannheimia] succiniciproducens]|uniref:BtuC protein n=1 Tax=Mannheimia succiniciproducens (strain KCTC 0769BP / MBEL55E) TaxID=221988 RepID=Q65TA0_MANSM|nr:Fe(3+)-hydroxamate ABC transporter permease FhuB [[Mannheimia] succiniciproducens]AAU37810.1 BtuC protein [[Mannheimia] succiniciproducens MBEL55E]
MVKKLNIALFALAVLFFTWLSVVQLNNNDALAYLLFANYTLPRVFMAILAGCALGIASSLLQQVINNPLASDNTLAVSSGAQFSLFLVAIFVPNWLGAGSMFIALIGALVALALVFLLAWRRTISPLLMILAGLVVNLYLASFSAVLMLFYPEESRGLLLWGAGSLVQESWYDSLQLLWQFTIALILIFIFAKPLQILTLNDNNAKSLGVPVNLIRFLGLVISAFLVAIVVSRVGMLGFVGLAASSIVRQFSTTNLLKRLILSAYMAAMLLLLTDLTLQLFAYYRQIELPTGAVTALLGTPLLLWLMFNISNNGRLVSQDESLSLGKQPVKAAGVIISLLLLLSILCALFIGKNASGWYWDSVMLTLRYPRLLVAMAAGIMLAVAGTLLQRLSHNPMASPELLGITSGTAFGILTVIFFVATPTRGQFWFAGILGGFLVLLFIMLINQRNQLLPEKILLTGISIAALFDALQRIVLAGGDYKWQQLLAWTSGSTYHATPQLATGFLSIAVLLFLLALPLDRWLALLALQTPVAQALGLDITKVRWILIIFSAFLTALSTLLVGPLSFIGLLAPHLAHFCGWHKPKAQLIGAVLLGTLVMTIADWLGRQLLFPYEIPAGLVATLIGGAYFLFMMRKI